MQSLKKENFLQPNPHPRYSSEIQWNTDICQSYWLRHMTWHFAFEAIHFKTGFWVGIFKFWIFDFVEGYWIKFLLMFALQAKFSKLSLVPKLEPLNEGGGAALLQLVMYHQCCTYNKRPWMSTITVLNNITVTVLL